MTGDIKRSNSIDETMNDNEIPAGGFSLWLDQTRQKQKTGQAVDVPCGVCRACCTSSYFIHIKPHETKTISKIPAELMFPAPGLPRGNVLLGYNEKGHCPMFVDNKCSIYDYRPVTCRTYDCRILAAAGLDLGDDRGLISRQVSRWKFSFNEKQDLEKYNAVQAAAGFISQHAASFPAGFIPVNIPQRALMAVKVYEVFMNMTGDDKNEDRLNPGGKIIKAVIDACEKFERD